jgi:thiamine-monophosphate kinase
LPPVRAAGPGDDTAVIEHSAGRSLLTVDMLVEGVDFDLRYTSGEDLGWKAVAVNVSDIAAMGGRPRHAVTALALRHDVELAYFDAVLQGLLDAAAAWDLQLVGGDLSGAREVVISVTMTGTCEGAPVLRSGARDGDMICVTGTLGGSAGGLFVLSNGLDAAGHPALVERHLRPQARVDAGEAIALSGGTAMIDVSDGVALDLLRLMTASGTGCAVESDLIPVDPALEGLSHPDLPSSVELALTGGEDYELLFTVSEERFAAVKDAVEATGTTVTRLGRVTGGAPELDGEPLEERKELGWDHLRNR